MDMYNDTSGNQCYRCKHNFNCPQHRLRKKEVFFKDEHFVDAEIEDYKKQVKKREQRRINQFKDQTESSTHRINPMHH